VPSVLAASQVPLVRMRYIQSVSSDALQAPLLVGAAHRAQPQSIESAEALDALRAEGHVGPVGRGRKWMQSGRGPRKSAHDIVLAKFERRNRKQRLRLWREELEFFEPN